MPEGDGLGPGQEEMVRQIVIYYRENERPVVDVVVPEQDITSGVIQIVVIEARW